MCSLSLCVAIYNTSDILVSLPYLEAIGPAGCAVEEKWVAVEGAAGADGVVRAVAVDPPACPFCDLMFCDLICERTFCDLMFCDLITEGKKSQHNCVVQQGLMVWYVQRQWKHLCGRFVI